MDGRVHPQHVVLVNYRIVNYMIVNDITNEDHPIRVFTIVHVSLGARPLVCVMQHRCNTASVRRVEGFRERTPGGTRVRNPSTH